MPAAVAPAQAQPALASVISNPKTMTTGPQFASLYVGDLHPDVTEAMLYEIFNSVGPVASIRVCRDSVTRKSLGYAYVNLHSISDAERALDTLNYSTIKDRSVRVMWSHRDPGLRKSGNGNVFVKNLDKNIDNKGLFDTFSLFGNILSCKVATDFYGKSLGYGFVHYESEEAAKQAISKVSGMLIGDKAVYVGPFLKKNERTNTEPETFTNLYVKNLPQSWTDEAVIKEEMEKVTDGGECTSICLKTDKFNRRFAFVNFKEVADAKKAIEAFHNKDFGEDSSTAPSANDDEDKPKVAPKGDDDHPAHLMYCQRAMKMAERKKVLTEKFPPKAPEQKLSVNLYVKNVGESVTDDELKGMFEKFGTITSAKVMMDPKGRSKGFGFVCFKTAEEATKAVSEMHLKVVAGKPLYVGLAEKKDERSTRLSKGWNMKGSSGAFPNQNNNQQQVMDGNAGQMWGGKGHPMAQQQMYAPQMAPGGKGAPMYQQPMMYMGGPPMAHQGKGMPMGMPMGGKPMRGQMMPMNMPGNNMMNKAMMGAGKGGGPMMQNNNANANNIIGAGVNNNPPMSPVNKQEPLTAQVLANAPPSMQKQMLGERLYPAVAKAQPQLAGKITGMMLEMENSELLMLLESESLMRAKINEALAVLNGGRD